MVKGSDGDDTLVQPFLPNKAQQRLIKRLWHRNLILKARQLGFTTLVSIIWLDTALFVANMRCGIVAQDEQAAKVIFRDKVKFAYENLPPELRDAMPLKKDAADELLQKEAGENRERVFEEYQNSFFTPVDYDCRVAAVIVHSERMRDKDGKLVEGFEIPDLRNGDILITKATHSLGWRHGHAAIVTDAAKGETMEAILLGNPTLLQNVSKWRTYPSFIHLRLKNHENVDTDKIAEYAKKKMLGIPYGLLTGIPVKAPEDIKETQCAHVVWYPYECFGYDLDSDGSWLVTPKDIARSDLLEVVQVYGVDPENIWP